MAERLRSLTVTIEVDTNKQTYVEVVALGDDDTIEEVLQRVADTIARLTDLEGGFEVRRREPQP